MGPCYLSKTTKQGEPRKNPQTPPAVCYLMHPLAEYANGNALLIAPGALYTLPPSKLQVSRRQQQQQQQHRHPGTRSSHLHAVLPSVQPARTINTPQRLSPIACQ